MQDRDRPPLTTLRRSAAAASGRATRVASRLPGTGIARQLGRLWQRRVRGRPDRWQASVTFPTGPDRPGIGEIRDWIEALEYAFEGRLDVYARQGRIAVETDPVSAELFDPEEFDAICERIAAGYGGAHSLAHVRKWRRNEGQLVRAHVIVPVKPLFPRDEVPAAEPAANAPAVGAD